MLASASSPDEGLDEGERFSWVVYTGFWWGKEGAAFGTLVEGISKPVNERQTRKRMALDGLARTRS